MRWDEIIKRWLLPTLHPNMGQSQCNDNIIRLSVFGPKFLELYLTLRIKRPFISALGVQSRGQNANIANTIGIFHFVTFCEDFDDDGTR